MKKLSSTAIIRGIIAILVASLATWGVSHLDSASLSSEFITFIAFWAGWLLLGYPANKERHI